MPSSRGLVQTLLSPRPKSLLVMQDPSFLDRRAIETFRCSAIDKPEIQISLHGMNVTLGGIAIAASARGCEMNRIPRAQWDLFSLATHFRNPSLAVALEPDIVGGRVAAAIHPKGHMIDTVTQDRNQAIRQGRDPIFGPAAAAMFTGASGIFPYPEMLKTDRIAMFRHFHRHETGQRTW
jgi:hypothetical protein